MTRSPFGGRSGLLPTALALLLLGAPLAPAAGPAAAEAQLRPHPDLHEAYFAWDEGRYTEALEGYLAALRAPGGDAHTREVSLLTGELHPVRPIDIHGVSLAMSPDGRWLQWTRSEAGDWVTFVEPVEGGERHAFEVRNGALSGAGHFAWLADDALHIRHLDEGRTEEVALPGIRPLGLTFAPDRDELFLTAGIEGGGDRQRIFRLRAPAWEPELLELAEGHNSQPRPVPGGRYLVFHRPQTSPLPIPQGGEPTRTPEPGPGVIDLESGRVLTFRGGAPGLAAGGGTMAWLEPAEFGITLVRALRLPADGLGAGEVEPIVLHETDLRIASPVVSPDGERVAYQTMYHTDWEIAYQALDDPENEVRVSREIQHDRRPMWITNELLFAVKGESRHQRSYLYDLVTGENYRLFHNNTMRTIAPEYGWVAHPDGTGIFISAERDGDTISPERPVFWIDLTRTVGFQKLVARLEAALDHERDLLDRGWARFAPDAEEIRAAADAVSVGRIYHYAEALYQFGSKFATQPGNQLAIEYLRETLESWGYEVELQWFNAPGRGQGARTANVIATLPGTTNPELVYVISSHFDSVLPSPGADDNSSGTTALLEAARVLADRPRGATIQFAFLTAEEAGLLGAREFVRRAQDEGVRIAGVLNNDMIGWTRSHRLDNTIRYSNDGIRDIQHAAAHFFSDLITYDARYYRGTDAAVFFDAYGDVVGGIGSYPVLGNPNYHQRTDDLWTINQRLVAEVSRTTVASIMHLADGPSRVAGLELAASDANGLSFAWDPAPEAMVTGYIVRVRDGEGNWREVERVSEPSVRITGGAGIEAVAVRSFTADGRTGYDDLILERGDGGW